jgi:hypothetical protein
VSWVSGQRSALVVARVAYNLGNLCRCRVLPKRIENWSLTSLQQRLVKTGGRLVKHARATTGSCSPRGSGVAGVRGDAAADLGAAGAGGVVGAAGSRKSFRKEAPDGEVSEKRRREQAFRVRSPTPTGQNWLFGTARGSRRKNRASTVHLAEARCILPTEWEPKTEIPVQARRLPTQPAAGDSTGTRPLKVNGSSRRNQARRS